MKQGISLPQIPKKLLDTDKELYDYLFGLQQALLAKQTDDYGAADKTSTDIATTQSDLTDLTTAFNDYVADYVDYDAISLLASGHIDFKNGLQVRWGSFVSNTDSDQTVTFGRAFSNNCLNVIVNMPNNITSVSSTNFVVNRYDLVDGTTISMYYIAIGY